MANTQLVKFNCAAPPLTNIIGECDVFTSWKLCTNVPCSTANDENLVMLNAVAAITFEVMVAFSILTTDNYKNMSMKDCT